jgi:hypothetical protein
MAVLAKALASVQDGKAYSLVAICGEAGTGKSRLIEEFKATLELKNITWMEGHAYDSTRNISYAPLINLIKRDLAVEEEDTPGLVAAKLEGRLARGRGTVPRRAFVPPLSCSGQNEPRILEIPPPPCHPANLAGSR